MKIGQVIYDSKYLNEYKVISKRESFKGIFFQVENTEKEYGTAHYYPQALTLFVKGNMLYTNSSTYKTLKFFITREEAELDHFLTKRTELYEQEEGLFNQLISVRLEISKMQQKIEELGEC